MPQEGNLGSAHAPEAPPRRDSARQVVQFAEVSVGPEQYATPASLASVHTVSAQLTVASYSVSPIAVVLPRHAVMQAGVVHALMHVTSA